MATLESPSKAVVQAEVDATHSALRTSMRPLDHQNLQGKILGHYRVAARSGAMTGTGVTAGGTVFSMRWADPTNFCVITFLEAFYVPTVVFTAQQELGLDAAIARGFTASDSAGTAVSLTGNNNKMRSSMASSLVTDMRISAATIVTAGTRTVDGNAFVAGSGLVNVVNAAAGTAYVNAGGGPIPFGFRYEANMARGEHPIVLQASEGLLVRNTVVFPAAGTAVLTVNIAWAEVAAY